MRPTHLVLLLTASLLLPACQRSGGLETRTFRVDHLLPGQVHALLTPYVFADRPGRPGELSVADGAVTVRETRDNLDRIQRMLETYDRPRPTLRLRFRLVEADGTSRPDPAIADVVADLRRMFRFDGYRLMSEAVLAADGGELTQSFPGTEWYVDIGQLSSPTPGSVRLQDLRLFSEGSRVPLNTSVTVPTGQTLVLGNAPGTGGGTVILVVDVETEQAADGTIPDSPRR